MFHPKQIQIEIIEMFHLFFLIWFKYIIISFFSFV